MKCKIKFDLESKYINFDFINQDEIPNNIVSLVLYEEFFNEDDNVKVFNFEKFKDLITLHIEVTLDNINLLENNKIETLYIDHLNLNSLNVSKNNKIDTLVLYDTYIESLDILTKFKHLEFLQFDVFKTELKSLVFPEFNLKHLAINKNNKLKNLDLNNIRNLKQINVDEFEELEKLQIDKLNNLESLGLINLYKLEFLVFGKIEKLFLNNIPSLKYIDGDFKDYSNRTRYFSSKQRVITRRRIFLLCESKVGTPEGLSEYIVLKNSSKCMNCGKYVLRSKKINLRKRKFLTCC